METAIVRSAVALVACALLGCGGPARVWEGRYPTAEYRLNVRDASGAPVAGAELSVVDGEGRPSYRFPIEEHHKGSTIVSDARGLITLHHVGGGYELGAACFDVLKVLYVKGTCDKVKFSLRITRAGKVETVPFDALHEAFPTTREGAERFMGLPVTRAVVALRVDRAQDFLNKLDPRTRQIVRSRAARLEWDGLVETELEFKVITRDVVLR